MINYVKFSVKKSALLMGFISLFVLNWYLIVSLYSHVSTQFHQTRILSEIEHMKDLSTNQIAALQAPLVLGAVEADVTVDDARPLNLRKFYRQYDSPLYDYADYMVKISDENDLDYRLLSAIAMQESQLCKVIPKDSYNCWGWGIYGSQVLRFDSYEEAIVTVAEGIRKNYVEKRGLKTASEIMSVYTPSSSSWAYAVNHFMDRLEN